MDGGLFGMTSTCQEDYDKFGKDIIEQLDILNKNVELFKNKVPENFDKQWPFGAPSINEIDMSPGLNPIHIETIYKAIDFVFEYYNFLQLYMSMTFTGLGKAINDPKNTKCNNYYLLALFAHFTMNKRDEEKTIIGRIPTDDLADQQAILDAQNAFQKARESGWTKMIDLINYKPDATAIKDLVFTITIDKKNNLTYNAVYNMLGSSKSSFVFIADSFKSYLETYVKVIISLNKNMEGLLLYDFTNLYIPLAVASVQTNNAIEEVQNVGNHNVQNVGNHNVQNVGHNNVQNVGNHNVQNVGNHNIHNVGNHNVQNVGNENATTLSQSQIAAAVAAIAMSANVLNATIDDKTVEPKEPQEQAVEPQVQTVEPQVQTVEPQVQAVEPQVQAVEPQEQEEEHEPAKQVEKPQTTTQQQPTQNNNSTTPNPTPTTVNNNQPQQLYNTPK